MKILVSISDLKKVKRGGKSELYVVAGVADRNPDNDADTPLVVGGAVSTDGGVQVITSAVYTGVKQGGSLNLAGIGIPLYYGEPGGALAVSYKFMESDHKERSVAAAAQALLAGERIKGLVATAKAIAPPLLGSALEFVFAEVVPLLTKNGDDDFGGGSFNVVGPNYNFAPGETVKWEPIETPEMVGRLRVEKIEESVAGV